VQTIKIKAMSKIDKKKARIKEQIEFLENEVKNSLTKKDSNTKEIDVGKYQRRIKDLQSELSKLK